VRKAGIVPKRCLAHFQTHHVHIRCADGREGRCALKDLEELNADHGRPDELAAYHEGHMSPTKGLKDGRYLAGAAKEPESER
jgi:hypothetical protein